MGAIVAAVRSTAKRLVEVRPAILPLLLCWWGLNFAYYGLSTWISLALHKLQLGNAYQITLMYQGASAPANLLSVYLVLQPSFALRGRKCVLVLGMGFSAVCAFGVGALSSANAEARHRAAIIALALLSHTGSAAGWAMLDCLSTEAFDSSVRGAA